MTITTTFDPHASDPNNFFVNELIPVSAMSARAFPVLHGAFYTKDFALRRASDLMTLTAGVHYEFLGYDSVLSAITGKAVASGIYLKAGPNAIYNDVLTDYRAVGGREGNSNALIRNLTEAARKIGDAVVTVEDISNLPPTWPPSPHDHDATTELVNLGPWRRTMMDIESAILKQRPLLNSERQLERRVTRIDYVTASISNRLNRVSADLITGNGGWSGTIDNRMINLIALTGVPADSVNLGSGITNVTDNSTVKAALNILGILSNTKVNNSAKATAVQAANLNNDTNWVTPKTAAIAASIALSDAIASKADATATANALDDRVTRSGLASTTGTSTNNTMHQKAISELMAPLGQPQVIMTTFPATGGSYNSITFDNIVTLLSLELGDVIRVEGFWTHENTNDDIYTDEFFTVDEIINVSTIYVNTRHAGKNTRKTLLFGLYWGGQITRVAKWYNASPDLGRAWVNVPLTNTINNAASKRGLTVTVEAHWYPTIVKVDGVPVLSSSWGSNHWHSADWGATVIIPGGSTLTLHGNNSADPSTSGFRRISLLC